MDVFIASARPDVIKKAVDLGAVGIATNPSVVAEVGAPWRKVLAAATAASGLGPMLVQVVAPDVEGMKREALEFREIIGKRLIVKVPMSPVAIPAMRALQREGFEVMITTIVTLAQGIVASQAGADQLGIYVGRAARAGIDPYAVIRGIREIIDRRGLKTKIGVGSINDLPSFTGSAEAGADNAAPVYSVLAEALAHPVTEHGLKDFADKWAKIPSA